MFLNFPSGSDDDNGRWQIKHIPCYIAVGSEYDGKEKKGNMKNFQFNLITNNPLRLIKGAWGENEGEMHLNSAGRKDKGNMWEKDARATEQGREMVGYSPPPKSNVKVWGEDKLFWWSILAP